MFFTRYYYQLNNDKKIPPNFNERGRIAYRHKYTRAKRISGFLMITGSLIYGYYLLNAARHGFSFFNSKKKPNVIYYNDHMKQRQINESLVKQKEGK